MKPKLFSVLAILAPLVLGSCRSELPSVQEVQKTFDASLKPEDPETKIVSVLKRLGWSYHFDPINERYATGYPKTTKSILGVETSVAVWIFVNKDRSVNHIQVVEINGSL